MPVAPHTPYPPPTFRRPTRRPDVGRRRVLSRRQILRPDRPPGTKTTTGDRDEIPPGRPDAGQILARPRHIPHTEARDTDRPNGDGHNTAMDVTARRQTPRPAP